jgi:hypothetical protein
MGWASHWAIFSPNPSGHPEMKFRGIALQRRPFTLEYLEMGAQWSGIAKAPLEERENKSKRQNGSKFILCKDQVSKNLNTTLVCTSYANILHYLIQVANTHT